MSYKHQTIEYCRACFEVYLHSDISVLNKYMINGELIDYAHLCYYCFEYINTAATSDEKSQYRTKRRAMDITKGINIDEYHNAFRSLLLEGIPSFNFALGHKYYLLYATDEEILLYNAFVEKAYVHLYNLCVEHKWFCSKVQKEMLWSRHNMSETDIKLCMKDYVEIVLKTPWNQYKNSVMMNRMGNNTCYILLSQLNDLTNEEDIINLLSPLDTDLLLYLRGSTYRYANHVRNVMGINDDQTTALEQSLKNKIGIYFNHLKKTKAESIKTLVLSDEEMQELITKVNYFLLGNYKSIASFCRHEGLSISTFNRQIESLKANNLDLYNLYYQKLDNDKNAAELSTNEKLSLAVSSIVNGFAEGSERPYDLIDYYLDMHMPLVKFVELCKSSVSEDELRKIRWFYAKNKATIPSSIPQILKDNNEITRDSVKYVVTEEDKKFVIGYLQDNDIPLFCNTYSIALRRYLNGTLPNVQKGQSYTAKPVN